MKRKKFIINILNIYLESLHRYVFDILYKQNKLNYSLSEIVRLKLYKYLCIKLPRFRTDLIYCFRLYDRAYKLKRLSFKRQIIYFVLLKINLSRYTYLI